MADSTGFPGEYNFTGTSGSYTSSLYTTEWTVVSSVQAVFASNGTSAVGETNRTYQIWSGTAPTTADYFVEGSYVWAGSGQTFIMYLRASSGSHTGYQVRVDLNGAWEIRRLDSGTPTTLTSGTKSGGFSTGTAYLFRGEVEGTAIRFYYDGNLLGSTTDATYSTAGLPVWSFHQSAYGNLDYIKLGELTATGVAFTGTVPDQTGTVGNAFSLNVSGYFSGGTTPYTYSVQTGTLPTDVTLNASTGVISGNITQTASQTGIVIRATDADTNPADTNAFDFTFSDVANTPPTWVGPDIISISLTEGVAAGPFDYSGRGSDAEDTITWTLGGGAITGLSLSTAGVLTVTEGSIVAGTYTGRYLIMNDGVNTPVNSPTFPVVIAEAPTSSSSVTTGILKNGANSVLASTSVNYVWFPTDVATSLTNTDWVTGTGTTSASGTLTTSANLPSGIGHLLVYTTSFVKVYFGELTAS